jgi:hypothetical protein
MSYVKRVVKLYEDGKVDEATMIKMAVFKEKVAELMKEGIDKNTLLLGAALTAGAGLGAAAIETVSDYFLSKKAKEEMEQTTKSVFDEIYRSPEIKKYPREVAAKYFKTLVHFSPHIASDPLSARTYLVQMLDWEDENQSPISVTTVRELAEVENKSMDALNKRQLPISNIGRFTEPVVQALTKVPKNLVTEFKQPSPFTQAKLFNDYDD